MTILEDYTQLGPAELTARLRGQAFALDTETTPLPGFDHPKAALIPHQSRVVAASLACHATDVHTFVPLYDADALERFRAWLVELLQNADTTLIGHNLKFDLHQLRIRAASIVAKIADTSVMVHLLDSRRRKKLEEAEEDWLGTTRKRDALRAVGERSAKHFATWSLDKATAYAGGDAVITEELYRTLAPLLVKWGLRALFGQQMRYLRALWDVEHRGVYLDLPAIEAQRAALRSRLAELEEELWTMAGKRFLWTSPQQLSKVIYGDLGVPRPKNPYADADGIDRSKFADRGKYNSTCTSSFLLMEKVHHPIGGLVLAMRETRKLGEDVLKKWALFADDQPALHTTLNLNGTKTGRLSSSTPNLENVPSDKRTRATQAVYSGDAYARSGAYNLRTPLIARPGHLLLSIDHKQQEMRLFGILSGDQRMLESLRRGGDIHRDIAEAVWGVRDDLHREWSKTIGFGLIYGMTTGSLEHRLNKTRAEAQQIANKYLASYPRIKPYMQEVVRQCQRDHYVRYWSGRIWREDDPEMMYRAVNALVQGGAGDLFSTALMRCHKRLQESGAGAVLLPVYDELLFELKADAVVEEAPILAELMSVPDIFGLPFPTDLKLGPSYGALTHYELGAAVS